MAKVVVLGLGYIGLPTATMLALNGNHVVGVDIQRKVIESLRSGNTPIREKDLTAIFREALRTGRLEIAEKPEKSEYFLICVPTPEKGHEADLSMVVSASHSVVPWLRKGATVVLESTVPPGTSMNVVRPILEKGGLRAGRDFHLAYCPERVLPGSIIREIVENDRIIGGIDRPSAEKARRLYSTFVRGQIHVTDLTTAEFVKLAENAFRDVNIALANELSTLAEAHGISVWDAIGLANRHPRVQILRPGPGVGGHCIAVDPWFLLTPKVDAKIIPTARHVNDGRPDVVVDRTLATVRHVKRPKVAAFGVAYKGNADDVRESPAIEVIEALRSRGVSVMAYDPLVPHDVYPTFPLEETLVDADCLLILSDHREFLYIDPALVANKVRRRVLFDTRNCVDQAKWVRHGFEVHVLGSAIVLRPARGEQRREGRGRTQRSRTGRHSKQ